MELFSVSCTTCRARLKVRDAAAIGHILGCPKCGGMVLVQPPADWHPSNAVLSTDSISEARSIAEVNSGAEVNSVAEVNSAAETTIAAQETVDVPEARQRTSQKPDTRPTEPAKPPSQRSGSHHEQTRSAAGKLPGQSEKSRQERDEQRLVKRAAVAATLAVGADAATSSASPASVADAAPTPEAAMSGAEKPETSLATESTVAPAASWSGLDWMGSWKWPLLAGTPLAITAVALGAWSLFKTDDPLLVPNQTSVAVAAATATVPVPAAGTAVIAPNNNPEVAPAAADGSVLDAPASEVPAADLAANIPVAIEPVEPAAAVVAADEVPVDPAADMPAPDMPAPDGGADGAAAEAALQAALNDPLSNGPPAIEAAAPPARVARPRAEVEARLNDKIPLLEFKATPLADVVDFISQASTLPITFDLDAMAMAKIDLETPITLKLINSAVRDTLQRLLTDRGMVFVVDADQLLVTTTDQIAADIGEAATATESLEIGDLLAPRAMDGEQLAGMVRRFVAPGTWQPAPGLAAVNAQQAAADNNTTLEQQGLIGQLAVVETRLVVTHTAAVRSQIATFFDQLRVARGKSPRAGLVPSSFTRTTQAEALLNQRITATFRPTAPLAEVLSYLQQQTGARLVIDHVSLAEAGLECSVPAALSADKHTLDESLTSLLEPLQLTYRVINPHTLEILSQSAAEGRLELEIHAVADLLATRTGDDLVEQVRVELGAEVWGDPAVAAGNLVARQDAILFDPASKGLLVLTSAPRQRQLERALQTLRGVR